MEKIGTGVTSGLLEISLLPVESDCMPARGHLERARVRARVRSVMAENTTLHVGQKFSNKNHDKQIDPKLKYATLQYVCK